jgi:transmembrane sensor
MTDDRMTISATAADWADRQGELTAADRAALVAWLEAAPAHAAAFDAMRRLLADTALVGAVERRVDEAPPPVRASGRPGWVRVDRTHRRTRWLAGAAAAAAAVFAIALPIAWHRAAPPTAAAERHVYASAIGVRRQVRLPDGSTMALDAASRVAIAFRRDARRLDLAQGAARFDVQHDAARPFTVVTSDARMTALGTNFAVDRGAGISALRVFRGRVRLSAPGAAAVVVGGGGWARIQDGRITIGRFDAARYHGWQDDWLEGDAMRLDAALAQLSRYSAQPIRVADPRLAAEPLAGRFRLDTPRRSAMQIGALLDLSLNEREGTLWLERSSRH